MRKIASNVVSLTFDALVCCLKSVQGFYMILTGSDVITRIMMSLMTSQLCTTKDSRYIAGNSSFWREI